MGENKEKVTMRLAPDLLAEARQRPGSLTSVVEDAMRAWLGLGEVDPFEELREVRAIAEDAQNRVAQLEGVAGLG